MAGWLNHIRGSPMTHKLRGRLPATVINAAAPDPKTLALNTSAANSVIPVLYGRGSVPGIISAYGTYSGDLYCLVIWAAGECYQIERVFINGADPPSDVSVRHYRGTTYQGIDYWVDLAIAGYFDTLVLSKPAGDMGICYSVFKIPATLTTAPQFQAIVKGKLVFDPDSTGDGDPFADVVGLSVHFTGTNGQTSATDDSSNAHTLTFVGNADIQSNQLDLDGTDDGVTVPDSPTLEFGTDPWTIEVRCTPATITGDDFLLSKSDVSISDYGFELKRSGANLLIYLSGNGSSFNIANGTTAATSCFAIGVETCIQVEYSGSEYVVCIDGIETYRLYSASTIFGTACVWGIGKRAAATTTPWEGKIRCFRFTKALRYGNPAPITNSPFSDSGTFTAGMVYSDNTALVFGDVATSPLYGAGATVIGLSDCKAWDSEEIATGIVRSRVSLMLASPQKTDAVLDLLCTYGDLLWVAEGDSIRVMPDRPVSKDYPAGKELIINGDFVDDTVWIAGMDWTISGGEASI